jgi:phosphatidate cytidylyltransferase
VSLPPGLVVAPWSVPHADYVAAVLAGILGLTLVAVVPAALARRGGVPARTLFARWLTWAALAPLWALACFSGLLPIALLLTALALLGLVEWSRLTDLPRAHRRLLLVYAAGLGYLSLLGAGAILAAVPVLAVLGLLQPVLSADVRRGMRDLAFGALGFAYLPLMLSMGVILAHEVEGGGQVLFAIGVAVAFSDVCAYVFGKTLGRHKLAPAVSPNKTVEGVLGNLAGAALGLAVFSPVLPPLPLAVLASLPLVIALGAVWGDLFESALKREFAVKDAGAWLPGFGGILDRIDSLIVSIPLIYYVLLVAGQTS